MALGHPDPAGTDVWGEAGCIPAVDSLLQSPRISALLRGHRDKAKTPQAIRMRRVERVNVFRSSSRLISAFPIWALLKHQFCSQLQTSSAAPGPHTGWCVVSLSSCGVSPRHCVLATGCLLSTLHCPTGENSSCLDVLYQPFSRPAGVPRTMCRKQELARASGCAWSPTKCSRRH